jgi:hypothetical protein
MRSKVDHRYFERAKGLLDWSPALTLTKRTMIWSLSFREDSEEDTNSILENIVKHIA